MTKEMLIPIFACLLGIGFTVAQLCPAFGSSENPSGPDDLAEIDSGFFVSKNDVSLLRDLEFKEELVAFLAEKGIVTKSSKGLIYYYISGEAIALVEDVEFRKRLESFITELSEKRVHVVRPGDSLWKIAKRYGISVDELCHLNSITVNDPLHPGEELVVTPSGN